MKLYEIFDLVGENQILIIEDAHGVPLDRYDGKCSINPVYNNMTIARIRAKDNRIVIRLDFERWSIEDYLTATNSRVEFDGNQMVVTNGATAEHFGSITDLLYQAEQWQLRTLEIEEEERTGCDRSLFWEVER